MSKIRDFTTSYNQKNIVGSVSQSGGIPTGAIIERGSASGWEYVKYADGTMICTINSTASETINVATGVLYRSASARSLTFPFPFVSAPSVQASTPSQVSVFTGAITVNTTTCGVWLLSTGAAVTATIAMFVTATGRWY